MKRYITLSGVLLAGLLTGCVVDKYASLPEENGKTRTVKVVAEMSENLTKTTMTGSMESGFTFNWSEGDAIQVFEILDLYAEKGEAKELSCKPLAAGGAVAEFEVTIPVRENPESKDFNYVAIYPPSPQNFALPMKWDDPKFYSDWYARLGYNLEDYGGHHYIFSTDLPGMQMPTANAFDPQADLMVSNVVIPANHAQADKLTMKFARVGSVLCMNLKGIPEGQKVLEGRWIVGESYMPAYVRIYDPLIQATAPQGKTAGLIRFVPQEVRSVNVGGVVQAPIWLRCGSGALSDEFEVQVWTGESKEDPNLNYYTKKVSLAGKNPLIFKDGGMTTFNVTLKETPFPSSVNSPVFSNITAHSASCSARYNLGKRAVLKEAYFVYQQSDGGYNVEKILREGTRVEAVVGVDNTFTAELSGLHPSKNYYVVPVIVMEHGEVATSVHFFETDKLEVVPEMIDLGLPSGTKWAAWNIGATKPEEYGDYYSWGSLKNDPDGYWNSYRFATSTKNPDLEYVTDGYCLSKYSSNIELGTVDNLGTLELIDDAAHVRWGGQWRLPTATEIKELYNNTTLKQVQLNGIDGVEFTSSVNGNKIFIPYAGYIEGYESYQERTGSAWIWSASPSDIGHDNGYIASARALKVYSTSATINLMNTSRCRPMSVRPVYGPYKAISDTRVVYTNPLTADLKLQAKVYPSCTGEGEVVTENSGVYLLINPVEKADGAYPCLDLSVYSLHEAWQNLTDNLFEVDIKGRFPSLPKGRYYYRVCYHHSAHNNYYGETRMFEIN